MRVDEGAGPGRDRAKTASRRAIPAERPSSTSGKGQCPQFQSKLPRELSATARSCNPLLSHRAAAAALIGPVLLHQVADMGSKLRCGPRKPFAMRNLVERMREM